MRAKRTADEWRGDAKAARGRGDKQEALHCYQEAMGLEHSAGDMPQFMRDSRHLADLHRALGNFDEAYAAIRVVFGFYRENPPSDLELANTLRIMALVDEAYEYDGNRRALWTEARDLYAKVGVQAGVDECDQRLAKLADSTSPAVP